MSEPTNDPGPRGIVFGQPESVPAADGTFEFEVAGVQRSADSPITSGLQYMVTCYPTGSGNPVRLKVTGTSGSPAQSITVDVSTSASGQLLCYTVSITASWSSAPPCPIAIGVSVSGTISGGSILSTPSSGPTYAFVAIT